MEILTQQQERMIEDFAWELSMVDTVDDIFPPDAGGVHEPRRPLPPTLPGAEHVCLAAVYDLAQARQQRKSLMQRSGESICAITQLVDA